jgi:hypothetical protein
MYTGYVLSEVGNCDVDGYVAINNAEECQVAALVLELTTSSAVSTVVDRQYDRPHGCYFKPTNTPTFRMWFNSNGDETSMDTDRLSICREYLTVDAIY